jgi:hypothetical protein
MRPSRRLPASCPSGWIARPAVEDGFREQHGDARNPNSNTTASSTTPNPCWDSVRSWRGAAATPPIAQKASPCTHVYTNTISKPAAAARRGKACSRPKEGRPESGGRVEWSALDGIHDQKPHGDRCRADDAGDDPFLGHRGNVRGRTIGRNRVDSSTSAVKTFPPGALPIMWSPGSLDSIDSSHERRLGDLDRKALEASGKTARGRGDTQDRAVKHQARVTPPDKVFRPIRPLLPLGDRQKHGSCLA